MAEINEPKMQVSGLIIGLAIAQRKKNVYVIIDLFLRLPK